MSTIDPKFLDIEHDGVTYHIPVGGNAVIDDTAGSGDTDKAWSANKLVTELAKKIGGNKRVWYGTATSVDKNLLTVSVSNFDSLQTGDVFHISNMLDCYPDSGHYLFIFINDINPGIQVRTVTGEVIPQGEHLFAAGSSATFIYNGTYLLLVNGTHASTTTYGTTKLENSSSSSSTTTALVPAALKSVVDNRIAPLETSVAGKADKDADAVEGNFAEFDSSGNPVDSGKSASDFLETSAIDDTAGTGTTGKTWSADKLANENTLTGSITTPAAIQTFSDGAEWPMEMEIAIEPVQSGTGDPSPSNVRPITGWDGANVNVSPTQDAQDATVYNITFPTSAGTVYGGTLTVHADGTGTLVVDRAYIELDGSSDENWASYASGNAYYISKNDLKIYSGGYVGHIICDKLKTVGGRSDLAGNSFCVTGLTTATSANYLYAKADSSVTTVSGFETWLSSNNIKVVYELATPVVYTLSAPQVLSLLDQNNVWADCGNINSLSYVRRQDIGFIREDTAGQIRVATDPIHTELNVAESSLAIVIDGDTAPKAIASGQYLFVKNHSTLATGAYHATAAIAKDASVTSNNTSPDADGAINVLNAKLGALDNVEVSAYNGTTSFAYTCKTRHEYIITAMASSEDYQGIWIVHSGSSNAYIMTVKSGASLTASANGLNLSIAKSGSYSVVISIISMAY